LRRKNRYAIEVRKLEAFRALGGDEELIASTRFTLEGGAAAAARLLRSGCTAIICASDVMALGVIREARSRGLVVPRDLSVIGHDDSQLVAFVDPPLTTVRQNVRGMAEAAVSALLEQIQGQAAESDEFLFSPELVVRGSTGAAPGRD
jgi:LacI family repressor for deo operon, udp, cdd, tsx, nupC, and nupG